MRDYSPWDPDVSPITLTITADMSDLRLDKVLSQQFPEYSRSCLQQWIEDGHITLNGRPTKSKVLVRENEQVEICPQALPEQDNFLPESIDFPIVYEDDSFLIVNKPAGLVVHPAAGNWTGTLLNGLLQTHPSASHLPRAGIVHRLDKDTSGLLVVAKTLMAQTNLVRQLQARTVKRDYVTLVWGIPPATGKVRGAIARHPRDRLKMAVSQSPIAKPAVTHYERLATGLLRNMPVSLVRCRLETGRTHQIRVHLQSIRFPLVGDPLYGRAHLTSIFPRQALHAYHLGLDHPENGEYCEWYAEPPADFAALLEESEIEPFDVSL